MLANDTDPDGDPLTLTQVTDGAHGTAELVDGNVVYTPDEGWAGADTVTYTVTDGNLTATGTLTVTTATAPPVNRAPKAVTDTALTDFETPVSVDVLSNDTDPDGDTLTLVSVDGAEHGTATVENGQVVYRPDEGLVRRGHHDVRRLRRHRHGHRHPARHHPPAGRTSRRPP